MLGLGVAVNAALHVIDKIIPDPQAKLDAKFKILQLEQAGEFKEIEVEAAAMQGQIEINKLEASSDSNFRGGWRPFIGWVCGAGFATQFVLGPWGTWVAALLHHPTPFPEMDMGTMMPLLLGLLGISSLRTVEKMKGKSKARTG